MATRLNDSEKKHMAGVMPDVWFMHATLTNAGRSKATEEDAYKAWAIHSKDNRSEWLKVETDEKGRHAIVGSYDTMVQAERDRRDRQTEIMELRSPDAKSNGRKAAPGEIAAIMRLEDIGFSPDPSRSRSEETVNLMGHIAGRLNNVEYMANAIDEADGIPPERRARLVRGGREQYEHLLSDDVPGLLGAAKCYNAIRQAQREDDEVGVRTGIALLAMADHGMIGHKDVLAAMGRDGETVRSRSRTIEGNVQLRTGGLLTQAASALPAPDRATMPKGPTQAALPAPERPGAER